MKRIVVLSCVMLLASAVPALAQKALAEAVARSAAGTFRNLVESAEKMPEADYGFQATKETRTFAGFRRSHGQLGVRRLRARQGRSQPEQGRSSRR